MYKGNKSASLICTMRPVYWGGPAEMIIRGLEMKHYM